jgi:phenylpropionate dioxygenase-like ring-hydroxylating dioxygenase large terminal subunit
MENIAQPNGGRPWHARYPELGTEPVPIDGYVSPDYFERERTQIFRRVWLNIGRVEQIPAPGDYFVKDLPVCNTSVIVVRDRDGEVRAFHNMCMHRGNQLVWDPKGNCNRFTCKFHAWTYGLDGSLRGVPEEDGYSNLDKAARGMRPVAVGIWEGFVFINTDPQPRQTLEEFLGEELRDAVSGYDFDTASASCFSWETELNANWKTCKDAFHEAFHVAILHHRSIGEVFAPRSNLACVLDFKLFERGHGRISLPANPEWKPKPVEVLARRFGAVVLQKNVDSSTELPAGINPTRHPNWAFDGYAVFPNHIMYLSQGSYLSHTFWPLAHDRTRWEIRSYQPRATNLAQRFAQEYGRVTFRDTLLEDGSTLERTQAMLGSGASADMVLHDQELLIRQSHMAVESYLRD